MDDGGMDGSAGRRGAGRVDPRCRRRLFSSSEQGVQGGDEAEVPLHQWKNVREKLSSVLGK